MVHLLLIAWLSQPTVFISSPITDLTNSPLQPLVFLAESHDSEQAGYSFEWSVSDGTSYSGNSFLFPPSPAGVYEVEVTVKNGAGEISTPDKRIIYVVDLYDFAKIPEISEIQTSRRNIHAAEQIAVTAIASPQDPQMQFFWSWNDGRHNYHAKGNPVEISFPDPFALNDSYPVSVVAMDSEGRFSFNTEVGIYIGEGNLPPEGRITSHETGTSIPLGKEQLFVCQGFDNENDIPLSYEWSFPDGSTQQGSQANYTFEQTGDQFVSCRVTDSKGQTDPHIPTLSLNVLDIQETDLFSNITFPVFNALIYAGEGMYFKGNTFFYPNDNVGPDGFWTIKDLLGGQLDRTFQGNIIQRIGFSQSGLFLVTFDSQFESLAAPRTRQNTRVIAVRDRLRFPLKKIEFQNSPPVIAQSGSVLHLSLDVPDQDISGWRFYWFANGEILNETGSQLDYLAEFPDPYYANFEYVGLYNLEIAVVGLNSADQPATPFKSYHVQLYRDKQSPIIELENHDLQETIFLEKGGSFEPKPVLTNPDQLDLVFTWRLQDGKGYFETRSGLLPGSFQLNNAGLYYLDLVAITSDGTLAAGRTVSNYIQVYDPELKPDALITKPVDQELNVDLGSSLRFAGHAIEPSFIAPPQESVKNQPVVNQLEWTHTDPNGAVSVFEGESIELTFEELGDHWITLNTVNSLGLSDPTPATRVIHVQEPIEDPFEPNNEMAQAAPLNAGVISNLQLSDTDPVDWYYLDQTSLSTNYQFTFDLRNSQDSVNLRVVKADGSAVHEQVLLAGKENHFTLEGGESVRLYFEFSLPSVTKKSGGLSFGMGVTTLEPQLVFPYAYTNEMLPFKIHLINPDSQPGQIQIEARTAYGELVGTSYADIPGFGKFESNIASVFPEASTKDVAWLQVNSDLPLRGVGEQVSIDKMTGIAEAAVKGSFQELIIPHIAQLTSQWYTMAALSNTTSFGVEAQFETVNLFYPLSAPTAAYESSQFDFLNLFDGAIPSDGKWGYFKDITAEKSLAGWEIFGKLDGNLQIASIGMIAPQLKNPNFTYVRRDIYFPHIAADTASFWTGMSLVNTGTYTGTGNLKAFDESGTLMATEAVSMEVGGKKVDVVPNFFPSLAPDSRIAWIVLETSDYIQGFELFGSNDGTNRRLAGFPAMSGASQTLYFSNVYSNIVLYWTGLAVVNVGDNTTTLSYEGFNDRGELVCQAERAVGPRKKDVALLENIFAAVPQDLSWVRVSSTQPVAGFSLFGDRGSNFMAGTLAQ